MSWYKPWHEETATRTATYKPAVFVPEGLRNGPLHGTNPGNSLCTNKPFVTDAEEMTREAVEGTGHAPRQALRGGISKVNFH